MSGEIQYKFPRMADWRDLTEEDRGLLRTRIFTSGQNEILFRVKPDFEPGWFVHRDWVEDGKIAAWVQVPIARFEKEDPGPNYRRVEVKIVDE